MLLFAALLIVILLAGIVWRRGRLQALADVPVRHLWAAPVALALQLPLMRAPAARAAPDLLWPRIAFGASYLLLGWALWANRRLPGISWLAAGVFLNGLAVVANGGYMPIAPQTVAVLGDGAWPVGTHHGVSKDVVLPFSATRLWFLSDIFVVPRPFPWPVAFSIGDVLIVVGVARFARQVPAGEAKPGNKSATCGKGNTMYQKHNRYPELIRLIGATAVSKRFRQTLLRNPEQILEHGYPGYQFDLTAEEAALVSRAATGTVQDFSLQLWEWMSRDGHGDGSQRPEKLPQTAQLFEDVLAGTPVSTVPLSIEEEERHVRYRRKAMDALILVVDDNRVMAEGLQFALEAEGFRVALALDGDLAIEFLEHEENERPDLILADIKMPRMDGYALLRAVKENPEWRDIPFVFVTAAADWREAVMAKSRGADEYVVKPFELKDLVGVVRRLMKEMGEVKIRKAGEEEGMRPEV